VCHLMAQDWKQMGLSETIAARSGGCESAMIESVKMAEAADVLIGSGSDLLGRRQNRRGLELTLKARVLSPMRAIQCATSGNAKIMRQAERLGSIGAGKVGDVIALDGDPLTQPDVFDEPNRVVLVIKDGVVVKDLLSGRSAAASRGTREPDYATASSARRV